jgi:hypothetical protein
MTLSELIKNLQAIEARTTGEVQVSINVKDYYSKYGEDATIDINATATAGGGYYLHDNNLTINANLSKNEGKNPKITFRA